MNSFGQQTIQHPLNTRPRARNFDTRSQSYKHAFDYLPIDTPTHWLDGHCCSSPPLLLLLLRPSNSISLETRLQFLQRVWREVHTRTTLRGTLSLGPRMDLHSILRCCSPWWPRTTRGFPVPAPILLTFRPSVDKNPQRI